MNFRQVVKELSGLVGSEVSVNLTDERFGPADGYLAHFSGTLSRIDDPIPGVDAPVYYFRFEREDGFAIHEALFERAAWETTAGTSALRIELRGGVIVTIQTH